MLNKYEEAKESLYNALWELCGCDDEKYTRACMGEYPEPIAKEVHELAVKLSALAQHNE